MEIDSNGFMYKDLVYHRNTDSLYLYQQGTENSCVVEDCNHHPAFIPTNELELIPPTCKATIKMLDGLERRASLLLKNRE